MTNYAVIYAFDVQDGNEEEFIRLWSELTSAIASQCASHGSRLHRDQDGRFIAYAQWPDKNTFDSAWDKLDAHALSLSQRMKAVSQSTVLHQLETTEDLFQ